jgi:hypothetical protein
MEIKILVSHHKDGYLYNDKIYQPIHVGKKSSNVDLFILGDNEGENISNLNPYYCELTATYWAWKNLNSEYKGICHYRRYFWHKNIFSISFFLSKLKYNIKFFFNFSSFFRKRYLNTIFFSQLIIDNSAKSEYINKFSIWLEKDISKNSTDIYALKPSKNVVMTNYELFSIIGENYLEQLKQIIEKDYLDYSLFLNLTLSSKELHSANMVIMKKDIFEEYSNFIFEVLEKHYNTNKNEIEKGGYKRVSGYMAEILTNMFVIKKKSQNYKIKYLNLLFVK